MQLQIIVGSYLYKYNSERFEPRWVNVVVWVIVRACSVVLRRTVVGVDWRFDTLGIISDDGFRSGCRNVSQHQQQSFSGLHYKPGRSLKPQQSLQVWLTCELNQCSIFRLALKNTFEFSACLLFVSSSNTRTSVVFIQTVRLSSYKGLANCCCSSVVQLQGTLIQTIVVRS